MLLRLVRLLVLMFLWMTDFHQLDMFSSVMMLYGNLYSNEVIDRTDKYFMLEIKGRHDTISVDRLKPAHLEQLPPHSSSPDIVVPTSTSPLTPTTASTRCPSCKSKSSDRRHVQWPTHLADFSSLEGSNVVKLH